MFKRVGRPVIFIVVIVIAALSYLAIAGVSYYNGDNRISVIKGAGDMRFGIDIRGGVDVTFKPETTKNITVEDLNAAKDRIDNRLKAKNIFDRDLYVDTANKQIVLRFPWKSDDKTQNAEAAIKELGAMSNLTFKDESGNEIITGKDVASASVQPDKEHGGYLVALKIKSESAGKFQAATTNLVGKSMSIFMDTTNIETATVNEVLSDNAVISQSNGGMTLENANKLAGQINDGALPFKLVTDNYSTISAALGATALNVTVLAGIVAFILICLFMIFYYRLPGFIACIGLCGHLAGTLLCISIPQISLTLPGIAGIILSIGMGVDCNVITAERIKEELRVGKTLDGAIDAGFERSFSAIFDGNITVIIVGLILWFMGSATVKSFGYTLIIGVIFNFIMGITFSRLMLKSASKFPGLRKNFLFGGASK